jgi:hypothetical protein
MNQVIPLLHEARGIDEALSREGDALRLANAAFLIEPFLAFEQGSIHWRERVAWEAEAEADAELSRLIEQSYLPVVSRVDWENAFEEASQLEPVEVPEWVIFLPENGVTVPEDSYSGDHFSFFIRVGLVQRISFVPNGPYERPSVDVSSNHCGFPDRRYCSPGTCGTCIPRTRVREPSGIVCICDHGQ